MERLCVRAVSAADGSGIPLPVLSLHVATEGGPPCVSREADLPHYAASTMKVAILAALHRSGLDLDESVPLVNSFASAVPGAPRYSLTEDWDTDHACWSRLGRQVRLGWLARQMIAHSSNLAANTLLERVGTAAVNDVWRLAGARHSIVGRGFQDIAAQKAGITNLVTAEDLVTLLWRLPRPLLDELAHNVHRVDLAAGLPHGTAVVFKNGWIPGVRHSAAIVRPPDADPYAIAVCYTGPLATGHAVHDPAARILARISARIWALRHTFEQRP
ncbi:serine hydrolase [Streptomyces sp. NPDC096205]|uniref:serine hydrolase n=1 Tax=Streptomyces sp. NPDC096205 TaxID=3366081 RepID=UPI003816CB0E